MSENQSWIKRMWNHKMKHIEMRRMGPNEELIKVGSDPPRKTREFLKAILKELGDMLEREIYKKEIGGEIIFPPKAIVFISDKDDKEWRGAKRKGLKEDLESICIEQVKAVSDSSPLSADSFSVELQVDGTLEEGKVRVQHFWEDERTKTPPISETSEPKESKHEVREIKEEGQKQESLISAEEREKTRPFSEISNEKFFVEVWRNGNKEKELDFDKNEVTIGRNSVTRGKVDINLDDTAVGRKHATLQMDNEGNFWITAINDNPTKVGDFTVPKNRTVQVVNNQTIQIIEFTLKLRK